MNTWAAVMQEVHVQKAVNLITKTQQKEGKSEQKAFFDIY